VGHSSGIDLDNELSERSLGGLDSSGLWERNPLLSMAALSVEHLKVRVYLLGGGVSMAALTVEHLKVMAASRACLRIQFTYLVGGRMVEHLLGLLIGWGGFWSSPLKGPY